jgi:hypothetical protein
MVSIPRFLPRVRVLLAKVDFALSAFSGVAGRLGITGQRLVAKTKDLQKDLTNGQKH